ncbi:Threonine-phosphate decarboxylase [Kluyvera cryocrescens]|uniref:Aminotransferase n=1 Tax=Kluyvera cryocrescens TaxID=580 RepID=A0A485ANP8_KLUCR|nr:Threonine-phosphate decarboxylase [Kluyvera cryocrescens]
MPNTVGRWKRFDCQIETYALREEDGWQLTERILSSLTTELDCLFLCTPNNPTGLLPERALLDAIAARCRTLGIALILDEAFIDFIADEPGFIADLKHNPHVWVLRSLTKFYAIPGLRLGYVLNGDERAVARLRKHQMPWSINAFAALAGERVLNDHDYQQATLRWLAREGQRLYQALDEIDGLTVYPGRANYLFLRCERADIELQYALLQQRVLIRSCANYPGLDGRYFRVAVRSEAETSGCWRRLRQVLS